MDIARGGELFDRLQKGALDEATAAVMAKHILQAVAYVHEQGIMHRDIKPENILIGSPGGTDVMLADFGLAIKADQAQGIIGTLQYLAPEVRISFFECHRAICYLLFVYFLLVTLT